MKKLVVLLHVAVLLLPGCHRKAPVGVSSGDVEVTVLDEDSRPLAEAWVVLAAFDTSTALTDSTGSCAFTDVPTISVAIQASKYRHQHKCVVLEVSEGQNAVEIILPSLPMYVIPVGSDLADVAADSQGLYVYVADHDNGTILCVSTETDSLVGEIAVGTGVHRLKTSSDGAHLYAANSSSRALSLIDLASRTVINTRVYPFYPSDLAVTATRIFVSTSDWWGPIMIIDPQSLEVVGETGTSFGSYSELEIGSDPDIIYIADDDDIFTYSVSLDSCLATTSLMRRITDLAVNRGSTQLYAADGSLDEVWVFTPRDLQLVTIVPMDFEPYSMTTSTDDATIYVGGDGYEGPVISGVDSASFQQVSNYVLTGYRECRCLQCSPGGDKLYSIAYKHYTWGDDIFVVILE